MIAMLMIVLAYTAYVMTDMVTDINTGKEEKDFWADYTEQVEESPILYPMLDEQGNYISYDVDTSDFDVKEQVEKTCDIIQGQFWVEQMQMMDIMYAVKPVLAGIGG